MQVNALYRFYDDFGRLLYIGRTNDVLGRAREHAESKAWQRLVTRSTVEHYDTFADLCRAEVAAIRGERPLFNIAHNAHRRDVCSACGACQDPADDPTFSGMRCCLMRFHLDTLAMILAGETGIGPWHEEWAEIAQKYEDRTVRAYA